MHLVNRPEELRLAVAGLRRRGARIGFVPTMGALHDGHLSLVHLARERSDRVVASVFVNPTQFGPDEDSERYPRDSQADATRLAEAGAAVVFLPAVETIYPPGHATFVEPGGAAEGLEGICRPGHFRGVATVVAQLFHLVQPDVAVFGEKDAQQLAVIRQLVRDLHLPVEIVAGPTVREADGLAMSSRNAFLAPEERQIAAALFRALAAARRVIETGERDANEIRRLLHAQLALQPALRIDYAEVVDAVTFRPLQTLGGHIVLPVAAHLGSTRLIDNLQLEVAPTSSQPALTRGESTLCDARS